MAVIPLHPRKAASRPIARLTSFTDLVPCDCELDERAADLLPRAQEAIDRFPPEAIADMIAYAAARLERVGFQMFR